MNNSLGNIGMKAVSFFRSIIKTHTVSQRGFTLVELLVVVVIFSIFLSFTAINTLPILEGSSLSTTTDKLITDVKQQQLKAMLGDTDGTSLRAPYSVYFTSTSYTVYPGMTYSPSNANNFTVTLDQNVELVPHLTNNRITFASASGMFSNYSVSANTVVVRIVATGESKTIHFNQNGTINQVD